MHDLLCGFESFDVVEHAIEVPIFRDMKLWVDNITKIFRDKGICMLLIKNKKEILRFACFGHDWFCGVEIVTSS